MFKKINARLSEIEKDNKNLKKALGFKFYLTSWGVGNIEVDNYTTKLDAIEKYLGIEYEKTETKTEGYKKTKQFVNIITKKGKIKKLKKNNNKTKF